MGKKMKPRILFFVLGWCFTSTICGTEMAQGSTVKIYQTRNMYDYDSPWGSPYQERVGGTGFVIEGNRILTNAHVVSGSAFIQVKKSSGVERYQAEVEWTGHDCDLAILSIQDETFFQNIEPLMMAHSVAPVQSEVIVLGYSVGGEDLSVTRGIISRTEVSRYAHSGSSLLCSQIDAAINPGNSGGPVISDNQVVGVVHQIKQGGQNLGYMIPIPIIEHFLKEVDRGMYRGFPHGGVCYQMMENPALRSFYQMEKNDAGVLVTEVDEHSLFKGVVFPGDILLAIDGISIVNDGTIDFEDRKRVSLSHVFSLKYYEEFVELEILRQGEKVTIAVLLEPRSEKASTQQVGSSKRPSYFISGGLVFQPLTMNYLTHMFYSSPPPLELLYSFRHGKANEDSTEIVVLTRVLPDCLNVGYQTLKDQIVTAVNGIAVKNMQDLVHIFETCEEPYYRISLESHREVVLHRDEVESRHDKILKNYLISHDRSEDLR